MKEQEKLTKTVLENQKEYDQLAQIYEHLDKVLDLLTPGLSIDSQPIEMVMDEVYNRMNTLSSHNVRIMREKSKSL